MNIALVRHQVPYTNCPAPPFPSPICPATGMDPHPHPRFGGSRGPSPPHPRFAGDGGSSPSPVPMGLRARGPCTPSGTFSAPTGPPQLSAQLPQCTSRLGLGPRPPRAADTDLAAEQPPGRPAPDSAQAPPNCGPSVDLGQIVSLVSLIAPGESAMMQLRLPPRLLTPPPLPRRWLGALLFNSRARRRCRLSRRTGSRRALPPAAASAALAAARAALLRASERTRSRRRPASASRTAATFCTDSSEQPHLGTSRRHRLEGRSDPRQPGIDACSCQVP